MPPLNNAVFDQLEPVLPHMLFLLVTSLPLDLYLLLRLVLRPPRWKQLTTTIKERPWSWSDAATIVLALLAVQLALYIVASVLRLFGLSLESIWSLAPFIFGTLAFHLPILIVVASVLHTKHTSPGAALGARKKFFVRDMAQGTSFGFAVIVPVMIASVLGAVLLLLCGLELEEQRAVTAIRSAAMYPWWRQACLIALAVTLVPLTEEIIFRGIAFPLLARRLGVPLAAVLISLLFAVLHFHIGSYAPLFLLSLTFCLAYVLSGSILVPVVMHSVFNLVMISLMTLQGAL